MTRVLLFLALAAQVAAAPGDTPEVKKLLEQRVALLKEALVWKETLFKARRITSPELNVAGRELALAELELADTPAKRREIYLRLFKMAVEDDRVATLQYERKWVKAHHWLKTRSARLEAEADLRCAGGVPPKDTEPLREPKKPMD